MEINTIIQAWRHKNNWPIKYNTLRCFSVQDDLAKVRKHRSDKHQHVPVRIDKTANNKTGDKACVLCSDSKDRRRSKWMCSTCEVPLCTRVILGEEGGSRSHHDLWHSAKDIMEEHKRCHQMLLDSRENKKKLAKTGNDADDIDSDSDVEETTSWIVNAWLIHAHGWTFFLYDVGVGRDTILANVPPGTTASAAWWASMARLYLGRENSSYIFTNYLIETRYNSEFTYNGRL